MENTVAATVEEQLAKSQAKVAELQNEFEQAQKVILEQGALIQEQEAQIARLQANPAKVPTITVGKVVYEVHGQNFKFGGVEYTVKDLLGDKKLQAELVKKGVGFLVKQETETEVKNG